MQSFSYSKNAYTFSIETTDIHSFVMQMPMTLNINTQSHSSQRTKLNGSVAPGYTWAAPVDTKRWNVGRFVPACVTIVSKI